MGDERDVDVCVIGSGPAGLSVARELVGSGRRLCLLESGDRRVPSAPDPLYPLASDGLAVDPESRIRAFGGTTKVWGGRWKRLDPIDLEPRDWLPGSGWPLDAAALAPFYDRAARAAGVEEATPDQLGAPLLPVGALVPSAFAVQSVARRDWGATIGVELERAPGVEVELGAHIVALEWTARRITRVVARRAGGGELGVRARLVVLAAGGIENARLLLASELGDRHDQVGRGYMDHPKLDAGFVEAYDQLEISAATGLDVDAPHRVGFRLSDELQRAERTLNTCVLLEPLGERGWPRRVARRLGRPGPAYVLLLRNHLEQEPDAHNRVRLGGPLDPHGRPTATVTWRINQRERRALILLHQALARELPRAGIGELHSPLLHGGPWPEIRDASHHMGTTRMGRDPRDSVVDPDGRVHDLDNLYVAGSSVFPTSGYSNPTATIAALAIRLADHLRTR